MEAKILINISKVLLLTFFTLIVINIIGSVIEFFKIYKSINSVESFEYKNFKFFVNGKELYNQFQTKYIIFNTAVFLFYFYLSFKVILKSFFHKIFFFILFAPVSIFSQNNGITNFDRGIKIGEIIVNGLSILKGGKTNLNVSSSNYSKSLFCVKNKLPEKIQFKLEGIIKKDDEEINTKKELVIPTNGKECFFELEKQIWDYEIILTAKKEIHKKGELKVDDDVTITINE